MFNPVCSLNNSNNLTDNLCLFIILFGTEIVEYFDCTSCFGLKINLGKAILKSWYDCSSVGYEFHSYQKQNFDWNGGLIQVGP